MSDGGSLPIGAAEYEAIEAVVLETARGRWFLAEYARRNRTADTTVLLDAIGRLEQAVVGEGQAQGVDRIRFDLAEMAKAILRMKSKVASLRPADAEHGPLEAASETLDGIVRTTERATSGILEAAERVQEAAWTLREGGGDAALCDALDRHATEIYTACSFQDLTAQRTVKIVATLRYLEGRINAMIDVWGAAEPSDAAPSPLLQLLGTRDGAGLRRSEVDEVIVDEDSLASEPETAIATAEETVPTTADKTPDAVRALEEEPIAEEPEPVPAAELSRAPVEPPLDPPARPSRTMEALAAIDALSTREKLRRFT